MKNFSFDEWVRSASGKIHARVEGVQIYKSKQEPPALADIPQGSVPFVGEIHAV